eukprot:gene25005-biopygen2964
MFSCQPHQAQQPCTRRSSPAPGAAALHQAQQPCTRRSSPAPGRCRKLCGVCVLSGKPVRQDAANGVGKSDSRMAG